MCECAGRFGFFTIFYSKFDICRKVLSKSNRRNSPLKWKPLETVGRVKIRARTKFGMDVESLIELEIMTSPTLVLETVGRAEGESEVESTGVGCGH